MLLMLTVSISLFQLATAGKFSMTKQNARFSMVVSNAVPTQITKQFYPKYSNFSTSKLETRTTLGMVCI
jgi:hypothetical protein